MADKKSKPTKKSSKSDWIIRIIVFGALGIVLVLALLDYQKKNQASETGTKWRELFAESEENRQGLPLKKLMDETTGSPAEETVKFGTKYIWKGPFREYSVTVEHDPDDPKIVTAIEGQ